MVNLYNPATAYYHFVFPTTYNPALGATAARTAVVRRRYPGDCGTGRGQYETHFRPDAHDPRPRRRSCAPSAPSRPTSTRPTTSTAVRAGDDIDICHVTTGGEEPKTCCTTADRTTRRTSITQPAPRPTSTRRHRHQHRRRLDAAARPPAGSTTRASRSTSRRSSSARTATSPTPSWSATCSPGHIHSTPATSRCNSPQRILDANRQPTIDVTGVNITMTAGHRRRHRRHRAAEPRRTSGERSALGDLGGFLEINVDVNDERRRPQGVRHRRRRRADARASTSTSSPATCGSTRV